MAARHEVTKKYAREYAAASKLRKGELLDELIGVMGWSRANARRAIRTAAQRRGPARAQVRKPRGRAGGWGGVTLAYNVNSREEVDEVIEQAEAAGATIGRAGGGTFWGGYSGVFIDPEGHPWEVAHNPFWSVTEDGRTLVGDGRG